MIGNKMKKVLALLACLAVLLPAAALAVNAPSGYTSNGTHMAYMQIDQQTVDVKGYRADGWNGTTYGSSGYGVRSVGDMTIVCEPRFGSDSNDLYLDYKVTAGSAGVTDGKLAIHADTMVGDDDFGDVKVMKDADNTPVAIGIESAYGTQLTLYFAGSEFASPASSYWFGKYYDRTGNLYNTVAADRMQNVDSGIAISWQNINLAAGESKTFSVRMHIGGISNVPGVEEPNPPSAPVFPDVTANLPQTGDSSQLALWCALLAASAISLTMTQKKRCATK